MIHKADKRSGRFERQKDKGFSNNNKFGKRR